MEKKLYIGNLPYSTVDTDLQKLFAAAGTVKSAQVIKDRQSGRSKGFGFVEMSSDDEAQNAITMFHGKDYSGRPLTVNIARPREDRPSGGGGGFRSGGGRRPGGGYRPREDQKIFGPHLGGDATTDAPPPKLSQTSNANPPPSIDKAEEKEEKKDA